MINDRALNTTISSDARPVGVLDTHDGQFHVLCRRCAHYNTAIPGTPIFFENIYPYSQECCACHVVVVQGHPGFSQLYGDAK